MGINGLLPLLKSVTEKVHLESLRGLSVAVDAYSWLHKGVFTCAIDLYNKPESTFGHIEFCVARVKQLLNHGIRPIIVFDGAPLPSKALKEKERAESRKLAREKAERLLKEGKVTEAASAISRSIDVTPKMAHQFIAELRKMRVEYVVAPYEADAQMAWLSMNDIVDAVVCEDSDLLVFGAKRILFKLDKYGIAEEIKLNKVTQCSELDMSRFSFRMFRQMCILSGCDYLPSIPGMGIKTAYRYFLRYRTLDRIVQVLRAEGGKKIHADYESMLRNAELAFCHQRIYDTVRHCITCLTPLPEGSDEFSNVWDFLGPLIPNEEALQIAKGKICPITLDPFVIEAPKPSLFSATSQIIFDSSSTEEKTQNSRITSKYDVTFPRHYKVSLKVNNFTKSYMSNPYIKEMGKPRSIKMKAVSPPPPLPDGQKTIRDFFAPRSQESNV